MKFAEESPEPSLDELGKYVYVEELRGWVQQMALITYREALNQALREELDRDERVFIMGEEVGYFGGAFKVTDGLLAVYGEKRSATPRSPN